MRFRDIIIIMALAALVAGCDFDDANDRDISFIHRTHIEERDMECIDCHEGAEDTDTPGMPNEEFCLDCHQTLDKELKGKDSPANEKCLYCHNPDTGIPLDEQKVVLGPGSSEDLVSAHGKHYEADVECNACHGDIAADDHKFLPRQKYMPVGQDCIACHEERELSTDCATCHRTYNNETPPQNHNANWLAHHGLESYLVEEGKHGRDCSTCHAQTECMECHTQDAPRDHTNFWRQRGHGIESSMNRERCLVCHTQDSCVRCHDETSPRNHRGAWGRTHCGACHTDGGFTPDDNNCAVCHRRAVLAGHPSSPKSPADAVHTTATDCMTCHRLLNLSHPVNELDCTVCH